MAGPGDFKTDGSIFGEHNVFPPQRQGAHTAPGPRLSPQIPNPRTWPFLRKRYHRNGLGIHHPTNLGQIHRKELGLLLNNLVENCSVDLPSDGSIRGNPDSFAGPGFVQQGRNKFEGKVETFGEDIHKLGGVKNVKVLAGLWNWWSGQY